MWEWSDKLKLGKSAAFGKKDLRLLPLTDAEFEADFFLVPESSRKHQERWMGMVIEREFGGVLAMDEVELPPPTVNNLANLLAHALRHREAKMRLSGTRYDGPNWQATYRVAEAVVTPERIALDWIEHGVRYHLLAHSKDGGLTYQGNYGMFRPEEQWTIELTRYTAIDGSVVLMAIWYEKDRGNEGFSMFELKAS